MHKRNRCTPRNSTRNTEKYKSLTVKIFFKIKELTFKKVNLSPFKILNYIKSLTYSDI